MKSLLVVISMFVCIAAHPQTSIAGVKFGESYEKTVELLEAKYGKINLTNTNEVTVLVSYYAGFYFDYILFGFQRDSKSSYFNRCIFIKCFDTVDEAKRYRDDIASQLKRYYKLVSEVRANGLKCFYGGIDPTCSNRDGFCLEIICDASESKSYNVRLYYGPYDYLNENF